jgi:hypothetical protein
MSKSWRDVLPVHPAADLFPMMSQSELRELGEDIRKNGLQSPVILWSPGDQRDKEAKVYLLDGRNRLNAMELVGMETVGADGKLSTILGGGNYLNNGAGHSRVVQHFREFRVVTDLRKEGRINGVDPYEFVLSINLHRRHLAAEQKRELIAKLLKATPDKSDRQIAEQTKTSPTTVGTVRAKLETTGEVSKLDTRTDKKGVEQPAAKPFAAARAARAEDKLQTAWQRSPEEARDRFLDRIGAERVLPRLQEIISADALPPTNKSEPIETGATVSNGISVSDELKDDLERTAQAYGVPIAEVINQFLWLGCRAFNRGFKRSGEVDNDTAWWLIEMHSKHPDTFNVGAWHGSCAASAIDVLYADRCVPVGKLKEWQAEKASMKPKEWRDLHNKRWAERQKQKKAAQKAAQKELAALWRSQRAEAS